MHYDGRFGEGLHPLHREATSRVATRLIVPTRYAHLRSLLYHRFHLTKPASLPLSSWMLKVGLTNQSILSSGKRVRKGTVSHRNCGVRWLSFTFRNLAGSEPRLSCIHERRATNYKQQHEVKKNSKGCSAEGTKGRPVSRWQVTAGSSHLWILCKSGLTLNTDSERLVHL